MEPKFPPPTVVDTINGWRYTYAHTLVSKEPIPTPTEMQEIALVDIAIRKNPLSQYHLDEVLARKVNWRAREILKTFQGTEEERARAAVHAAIFELRHPELGRVV